MVRIAFVAKTKLDSCFVNKEVAVSLWLAGFLCFKEKHLYLVISVGWSVGLQNILIFFNRDDWDEEGLEN